jgi:hypothetical protein
MMSSTVFRLATGAAAVASFFIVPAAGAQSVRERVQVHGYLTQGFGASDSLQILGIGNKGSADYRAAALQLRVTATDDDAAVVQIANRRMGASRLNGLDDAVTLQWAYYQRRLGAGFAAKVGRAPMPKGIYNEVRKVGTVLPFYRAPYNFYTESYETVDGAILSHALPLGRWSLESNVYAGVADFRQSGTTTVYKPTFASTPGGPVMTGVTPVRDSAYLVKERTKQTAGAQLWLDTPVDGLRLGVGATRFKLHAYQELSGREGPSTSSTIQGAIDGSFTRFQLRGEWVQFRVNRFMYTSQYVQGGVKVTEKLSLVAQREQTDLAAAVRPVILGVPAEKTPRTTVDYRYGLDHAVGAGYAFLPGVVLKAEAHRHVGRDYETRVAAETRGHYFITSLALSF